MLAMSRYSATCLLAIFPPFVTDAAPGAGRVAMAAIHQQPAPLAPGDRAGRALPWVGSALGGLSPATAQPPRSATPSSACCPHGRASPFMVSVHRGWQGQMTNIQLSSTPIALRIYTVC